ncbi:DNA glycosylase AlkZ-like family protein [uncultured Actinomyces sp.]|uniref:DNA glycosylase AlkZ-like family protein n=1 Tax=uncultured Actinomyces sp. TaxID=249061 RepID=UPI00345B617C
MLVRADLPDLLAASRRRAAGTHFLAAFDEVHVGYKDRACLTDAAGERLICPAANGMFRPLLVDRGRVVAVRPAGAGLLWADDARRSARLERDVERAVRDMERRLA